MCTGRIRHDNLKRKSAPAVSKSSLEVSNVIIIDTKLINTICMLCNVEVARFKIDKIDILNIYLYNKNAHIRPACSSLTTLKSISILCILISSG